MPLNKRKSGLFDALVVAGAAPSFSPPDKFPEAPQCKDNTNRKGLYDLINCQVTVGITVGFEATRVACGCAISKDTWQSFFAAPLSPPPPRGPVGPL